MTITLPEDLSQRLAREASSQGLDANQYASRILEQYLRERERKTPLAELFSAWAKDDPAADAEDVRVRTEELIRLQRGMNESRLGSEGRDSRKPWP